MTDFVCLEFAGISFCSSSSFDVNSHGNNIRAGIKAPVSLLHASSSKSRVVKCKLIVERKIIIKPTDASVCVNSIDSSLA